MQPSARLDPQPGAIIPTNSGQTLFISMLRQFFLTIPLELYDAARIDGAGEIQILTRVILPLACPALAMVALSIYGRVGGLPGPLIGEWRTR